MPVFGPTTRKEMIQRLKELGFAGPYSGGKHQFMTKGHQTLRLPNPHQVDIGRELLARILRQGEIDKAEWEKL
jgi:predicted RNA binding protein YcfA (HicA-like mRNA interferase family)